MTLRDPNHKNILYSYVLLIGTRDSRRVKKTGTSTKTYKNAFLPRGKQKSYAFGFRLFLGVSYPVSGMPTEAQVRERSRRI